MELIRSSGSLVFFGCDFFQRIDFCFWKTIWIIIEYFIECDNCTFDKMRKENCPEKWMNHAKKIHYVEKCRGKCWRRSLPNNILDTTRNIRNTSPSWDSSAHLLSGCLDLIIKPGKEYAKVTVAELFRIHLCASSQCAFCHASNTHWLCLSECALLSMWDHAGYNMQSELRSRARK